MLVKFKITKFKIVSTRQLVNSFTCQLITQFPVVPETVQGITAGLLVALLLGITLASRTFLTIDDDLRIE